MKKTKFLFLCFATLLLLSFIISLPIYAQENIEKSYHIKFSEYYKYPTVDYHLSEVEMLTEFLKGIDAEIRPGQEFTYSSQATIDNISGVLSMKGQITKDEYRGEMVPVLAGSMEFSVKVSAKDPYHILYYDFSGPFKMFFETIQVPGQEGERLQIGYELGRGAPDGKIKYYHYNKELWQESKAPEAYLFTVKPLQAANVPITQVVNTEAAKTSGETNTAVGVAIVIGLAGAVAAAAGSVAVGGASGAAAGATSGINEEKGQGSTYKMAIYKEFGDRLKYNADPVFVYARMLEINSQGVEVERSDLTEQIEIFSTNQLLDIGPTSLSRAYLGASVYAGGAKGVAIPEEVIISFRFTGEGGVFQNNVKFKLIGEGRIELDREQLYVLAASGRSFELPFKLIDFLTEPQVNVCCMKKDIPFILEAKKDKKGNNIIIATDMEEKKSFEKFFESYSCEVIAEYEKEYARAVFYVEMCYEGVLADFLGKPKEIRGYRVSMDSDEMAETLFNIKLGVWDETDKSLRFVMPENIYINLTDKKNIFELIGTDILPDENSVLADAKRFIAKAKKNFPATNPVQGTMEISAAYGENTFENEIELELAPDVMQYTADYEKEYLACKRVIEIYMAPRFRGEKLYELEKAKYNLGLEDFKVFRRKCWSIAEISIMQEGQEYLAEAAWYDEAIATADLVVYIGDIAFDLALAPIGGPIAGFLAGQVKSGLLELYGLYVEGGAGKSTWDLTTKFVNNRLVQSAGSADGLIEVPKVNEPKKLAAWLSCYVIYRIGYHWHFDKDDNNNPIGITESIKRGLLDFVGKGAGALLGDFISNSAKGRWTEKISIADADQALTNDVVTKGTKSVLDAGDKLAGKADDAVAYVVKILSDYLEVLRRG
ncbi:MAG: hypothetical protein VR72_09260 [Clostridiaceae bacterium BRH_c20a]|nr:MAG: hypothetical protein VR72_09260 [Clostridiaceae bacterium BRH_c20a]